MVKFHNILWFAGLACLSACSPPVDAPTSSAPAASTIAPTYTGYLFEFDERHVLDRIARVDPQVSVAPVTQTVKNGLLCSSRQAVTGTLEICSANGKVEGVRLTVMDKQRGPKMELTSSKPTEAFMAIFEGRPYTKADSRRIHTEVADAAIITPGYMDEESNPNFGPNTKRWVAMDIYSVQVTNDGDRYVLYAAADNQPGN